MLRVPCGAWCVACWCSRMKRPQVLHDKVQAKDRLRYATVATEIDEDDAARCPCPECIEQLKLAVVVEADIEALADGADNDFARLGLGGVVIKTQTERLSAELEVLDESTKLLEKQVTKSRMFLIKQEGVLAMERRKKSRLQQKLSAMEQAIVDAFKARMEQEKAWKERERKAAAEYEKMVQEVASLRAMVEEEERLLSAGLVKVRACVCVCVCVCAPVIVAEEVLMPT